MEDDNPKPLNSPFGNLEQWDEYTNVNEIIEQKDFTSIFEFLKTIRYKQKKRKRYEIYKQTSIGSKIMN